MKDDVVRQKYDDYLRAESTFPSGRLFNPLAGVTDYFEDSPKKNSSNSSTGNNTQDSSTKEKPYKCTHEGCDKSYDKRESLNAHKRTKHPSYACTKCDKLFSGLVSLDNHMRRDHASAQSDSTNNNFSAGFNTQGSSASGSNNQSFNNQGSGNSSGSSSCYALKKCSYASCNNQIPSSTGFSYSPCCSTQQISLCSTCLDKSQIPCPGCHKNLQKEVAMDGRINFKKSEKKCSHVSCINQIPSDTGFNYSPCCLSQKISLCEQCSAKQVVQCPRCFNSIKVELNDQGINLKRPSLLQADTLLHDACKFGQINIVEFLLAHNASVNRFDHNTFMPIHYACEIGNYTITELLLKYGANVSGLNRRIDNSYERWVTPLHLACSRQRYGSVSALVRLLLDHGAAIDINRPDNNNSTPLQLAQRNNDYATVELLNEWLKK